MYKHVLLFITNFRLRTTLSILVVLKWDVYKMYKIDLVF